MENIIFSCILAQAVLLPLAWKWELRLGTVAAWGVAAGVAAGAAAYLIARARGWTIPSLVALDLLLILLLSAAALLLRFYRDAPRISPRGRGFIVSPADGRIKYIREIDDRVVPVSQKGKEKAPIHPSLLPLAAGGAYLIGIGMTFLDVHITRAPIGGRLSYFEHIPGPFLSLKEPDAPYRNERAVGIIRNEEQSVGFIQIASRLVRRIVSYSAPGDLLRPGQKLGMIRFGSQVDLLVPKKDGLRLQIYPGQQVYAGVSIIAKMRSSGFRVQSSELKKSDPSLPTSVKQQQSPTEVALPSDRN